jgi:multidrug efflux pump subunit AcrA (membrane-fusion protein)
VGTLYVEVPDTGGKLKPVTVRTLITDGNLTAIRTEELKEGDEVIVGLATARAGGPGGGSGQGSPGGGRRPF